MDNTSVAIISGAAGLAGVSLGFVGNLIRDHLSVRRRERAAKVELMAACRQVFHEISGFPAAAQLYRANPGFHPQHLITAPLAAREQWDRYSDVIARQGDIAYTLVSLAYSTANFATVAIQTGQPISDAPIAAWEASLAELRPYIAVPERVRSQDSTA